MVDELGPFDKILKYIQEQKKMPHVATNIALKELTWPPENKAASNPPIDVSSTFPVSGADDDDKPDGSSASGSISDDESPENKENSSADTDVSEESEEDNESLSDNGKSPVK